MQTYGDGIGEHRLHIGASTVGAAVTDTEDLTDAVILCPKAFAEVLEHIQRHKNGSAKAFHQVLEKYK